MWHIIRLDCVNTFIQEILVWTTLIEFGNMKRKCVGIRFALIMIGCCCFSSSFWNSLDTIDNSEIGLYDEASCEDLPCLAIIITLTLSKYLVHVLNELLHFWVSEFNQRFSFPKNFSGYKL